MPLMDTAAQNASLDNDYGATKGPNAPASFRLRLWVGDPTNGGEELAASGGYAPAGGVTNDGANFPPAADGSKTAAPQSFGTSTGEWGLYKVVNGVTELVPDVATHYSLEDEATGTAWDTGQLGDEISVEAAGTEVTVQPVIFYNGGLTDGSL